MIEKEIETGGFKYRVRVHPQDDGVVFDILDRVTLAGSVEDDVIASGKLDSQGRLKMKDIYCDVHAAMALGDILKFVYDNSYEFLGI